MQKILIICNGRINGNRFDTAPWIRSTIDNMSFLHETSIEVYFVGYKTSTRITKVLNGVTYTSIPYSWNTPVIYSRKFEKEFEELILENRFDIIHVYGTEYPFSLAVSRVCKKHGLDDRLVLSMQGLVTKVYKYYCLGLNRSSTFYFTFRDLIRLDNIGFQRFKFWIRSLYEKKTLLKIKYVTGRTSFDYSFVREVNPNIDYFLVNEMLRECFYHDSWSLQSIDRHSIFFSQMYYPIKGFHIMIEALNLVKKEFPDVHLYTTGPNILGKDFRTKFRESYYIKLIRMKIEKYQLEKNITFLGTLDDQEMKNRYLKSNVFVSASTVENSSNSICEAMILGVPTISSAVGGVFDFIEHRRNGFLYPVLEHKILSDYIVELFTNDTLATSFSSAARETVMKKCDPQTNTIQLSETYSYIRKRN